MTNPALSHKISANYFFASWHTATTFFLEIDIPLPHFSVNWHTAKSVLRILSHSKNIFRSEHQLLSQHIFHRIFSGVPISAKNFCDMTIAAKGVILLIDTQQRGFISRVQI
jgi:hypothetical protein